MLGVESPYAGLTVLNLGRRLASVAATQLLAALGARVIRVEEPPPGPGEPSPSRSPAAGWDPEGELFRHFGGGSESRLLDLDNPEGVRAACRLAEGAEIVITDEEAADPRGVRRELTRVRARGATFSLVSITPYGLSGPAAGRPATDLTVFAESGLMANVGDAEIEPPSLPDWLLQGQIGLAAFTAVGSLIPIDGSAPRPQDLDLAEVEVFANNNPHSISEYSYKGVASPRPGWRMLPGYPWTVLPCKDGHIGVIVPQTRWDVFCLMLDRPDLVSDPRFSDRYARSQHPDELDEIMIPWVASRTREELYREAQARGLPFGAVFTAADSLDSEQLRERRFFDDRLQGERLQEAPGDAGPLRYAGLPMLISARRPRVGPAPELGSSGESPPPDRGPETSPRPGAAASPLPLQGVRILELTTALAGPFGGRILADLGAEVIKVESRRRMDMRGPAIPPPGQGSYPDGDPGAEPWNRSARYHERNRSKLSLTLELGDPAAREIFLGLARASDVVLENFSPRVLPQLGIGWQELSRVNPGIILLSLSGFGHSGPEQDYVAYGPTVEQVCGLSSMLGAPGELPTGTGLFVPDIVGGTLGAGLVMAALRGRARDGVGCHLDLAESESVRWMMGHLVLDAQAGRDPELQRLGNRHRQFAPHGTFSCQEPGLWVAIAIRSDEEWARLAPELDARARDLPFRSQAGRHADQAAVEELVGSWTRGLPRDRVLARLAELAIPAAPVATVDEVFRNEHFLARRLLSQHPIRGSHSRGISGGLWVTDGERPGLRWPAPDLGQHNDYVLGELAGLSGAEIARLEQTGVIGRRPAELDPD